MRVCGEHSRVYAGTWRISTGPSWGQPERDGPVRVHVGSMYVSTRVENVFPLLTRQHGAMLCNNIAAINVTPRYSEIGPECML